MYVPILQLFRRSENLQAILSTYVHRTILRPTKVGRAAADGTKAHRERRKTRNSRRPLPTDYNGHGGTKHISQARSAGQRKPTQTVRAAQHILTHRRIIIDQRKTNATSTRNREAPRTPAEARGQPSNRERRQICPIPAEKRAREISKLEDGRGRKQEREHTQRENPRLGNNAGVATLVRQRTRLTNVQLSDIARCVASWGSVNLFGLVRAVTPNKEIRPLHSRTAEAKTPEYSRTFPIMPKQDGKNSRAEEGNRTDDEESSRMPPPSRAPKTPCANVTAILDADAPRPVAVRDGIYDTVEIKIENLQKVQEEESEQKRQRIDGDNSTAYKTVDLIGENDSASAAQMSIIDEHAADTEIEQEPQAVTAEEEFIPVGARGKVHWTFAITAATTNDEIKNEGPGSLTNAVIQVEKMLNTKVQDTVSPLGPQDLARKARDLLVREAEEASPQKNKGTEYLIPNPVFDIDATTQQTPGVRVTPEEQSLADAGVLEYTFQVELNLRNLPELTVFQQFANKLLEGDKEAQLLPWFANERDDIPTISQHRSPFQTIRGNARLKNFLGPYNRNKSRLYGRVKLRSKNDFEATKQHLVEWLRKDLHWVKADYIQARRISNIGLLLGTYGAVDVDGTRTAIEQAVKNEIGRELQLDLKLRRFKCKSRGGKNVTTTAFSVSVDSRKVSEATKGLRAVLNRKCVPPTGRRISFITKATDDMRIQQKHDSLLAQHHESIANERKLFRKLGVTLTSKVTLTNGNVLTLQQALCALTATRGGSLFTGVERMGKTDTSLFTTHKANLTEAKRTLQSLPQVIQRILTKESYERLSLGSPPQHEPEYEAMIRQESDYLNGLLNLEHCTEIDITKKRKKDDETVGAHTAMSGLTNVSPQTQTTAGTGAWINPLRPDTGDTSPMHMDIDEEGPNTTQVTSTLTSTHPDVARLESESRQQQQLISSMGRQIQHLKQSVQELVQYRTREEENKVNFDEWQKQLKDQVSSVGGVASATQQGQAAIQKDMSSLKDDIKNIMTLLQGGKPPVPQPANLVLGKTRAETRAWHLDPPPGGSGKI